jgi:hypothetical protein
MSRVAHTKGKTKRSKFDLAALARHRRWLVLGACLAIAFLAVGAWRVSSSPPPPRDAPEADKILAVQANMPFQILIPGYLPEGFDRAGVEIKVTESGPGGEPMTQLAYRTRQGATVFVREWVPVNPDMEILAGSRPIQTKWGKGWLLTQGKSLVAAWVDIGPLRVSIYTHNLDVLPKEYLVKAAETMGPASNQQVFSFVAEPPTVANLPPPPPFEVKTNDQGVQELTLVVTPGGYSPLRFAVKKGVPVRLVFRMLGQVGCGNELIFPADPNNPSALALQSESDEQVLEFTPQQVGQFEFHCSHYMYRGIMTVRE